MNKLQQFYVLKFNSGRLAKDSYNINITMKTAKKNNELIALGDNQVLRSIRKIKGRNIFRPKGLQQNQIVVSLAVAESILRRNPYGVSLKKVEMR